MATPMISPLGEPVWVDDDVAEEMTGQGYVYESAQEQEVREFEEEADVGDYLGAGIVGAAREVTLGGSDVFIEKFGDEEHKRLSRLYKEALPGATAAGELTGFLLGGEVIGLAKAGAAAGRGAQALVRGAAGTGTAARVAGTAARLGTAGAVEGAVFGAGAAVSEAALSGGNYDGLAEKMVAGATRGALYGGAAGGALGVAGGGLRELGRKVGGAGWVKKLADESWLKSVDPSKKDLRKLTKGGDAVERIAATGRSLREQGIVGAGLTKGKMLQRAEAQVATKGDEIGGLVQKLDDIGKGSINEQAAARLRKEITDLAKPTGRLATRTEKLAARRLKSELADVTEALAKGERVSHRELHAFRAKLGDSIKWAKAAQDPAQEQLSKAYGSLSRTLEDSGERAFAEAGETGFRETWKAAQKDYAAAKWAEDVLTDNVQRGQANLAFGLTEQLSAQSGILTGLATGSLGTGALLGLAGGVAGGAAKRFGRGVFAETLDAVAKFDRRVDTKLGKFMKAAASPAARAPAVLAARDATTETDKGLSRRKSESLPQAYHRTLRELEKQATTPAPLDHVRSAMPETGKRAEAIAPRAARYLLNVAPTSRMQEDTMHPTAEPPEPHPSEIQQFARAVRVAKDPLVVLDLLEDGKLTMQHVDALKSMWPEIYREVQEKTMTQLAERKTPLPYLKRIALGTLLSLPTDRSLRPEHVASTQAVYAARLASATPPQGGAATPNTPNAMASQFASSAQKLEAGNFDQI